MTRDEQEIRTLVSTWIEATKKGDIQTILGLMTEDVVFLLPGQSPMIGRAAFEAAAKAQDAKAKPEFDGTSEIQEIQILGDYAYIWTRLKVVITPPDGSSSITRAGHTLSILKKQSGKWMIARDANLLAPVQEE